MFIKRDIRKTVSRLTLILFVVLFFMVTISIADEVKPVDKSLVTLKGHNYYVSGVSFSKNDRYIISTSLDGVAILWNSITGEYLYKFDNNNKQNKDEDKITCGFFTDEKEIIIISSEPDTYRKHDVNTKIVSVNIASWCSFI